MAGVWLRRTWPADVDGEAPARFRPACTYELYLPAPIADEPLVLSADLAAVVADAEAAVRSLNAQPRPELRPLGRLLLRTEAHRSARRRADEVDARVLARAEARSRAALQVGPAAQQILTTVGATERAIERCRSAPEMGPEHLVAIHDALMRPFRPRLAGRLRSVQNWVGGNTWRPCQANYVPPPPDEVRRLVADLCQFCNSDELPVLVQAATAHGQLEAIHPFVDGNGRTGRALVHALLRRRRLAPHYVPPIGLMLIGDRGSYHSGLARFRGGDVTGWIEAFAVATARSAQIALEYVDHVAALRTRWHHLLHRSIARRPSTAASALLEVLPAYPVITVGMASTITATNEATARKGLEQLERAGVLRLVPGGRAQPMWEAPGLLDRLVEVEAPWR